MMAFILLFFVSSLRASGSKASGHDAVFEQKQFAPIPYPYFGIRKGNEQAYVQLTKLRRASEIYTQTSSYLGLRTPTVV